MQGGAADRRSGDVQTCLQRLFLPGEPQGASSASGSSQPREEAGWDRVGDRLNTVLVHSYFVFKFIHCIYDLNGRWWLPLTPFKSIIPNNIFTNYAELRSGPRPEEAERGRQHAVQTSPHSQPRQLDPPKTQRNNRQPKRIKPLNSRLTNLQKPIKHGRCPPPTVTISRGGGIFVVGTSSTLANRNR